MTKLDEELTNEINHQIIESLGVSQEVIRVTDMIKKSVTQEVEKHKTNEVWDDNIKANITRFTYPITVDMCGASNYITLNITVVRYPNHLEIFKANPNEVVKSQGSSTFKKGGKIIRMYMNLVLIYDNNKSMYQNADTIQHEVNHLYQQYLSGHSYPIKPNRGNIQNTVANGIFDTPETKIHFLCNHLEDVEQDSQINGLYSYILDMFGEKHPSDTVFNNAIKQSECYHIMSICRKYLDDLKNTPINERPNKNFLTTLGYDSFDDFIKKMRKLLQRFINKFGKVLIYIKDTIPNTNESMLTRYCRYNIAMYLLY